MKLHYRVVDVFTSAPLEGNPLAVFTDPGALDPGMMQRIAKELNLAETAFLLPATREDCDIRVRIFTPAKEMLFAGHPTIGSAYVALAQGLVPADSPAFVLEEAVGPVPVRVERDGETLIWLTTPPIVKSGVLDASACARAVGLARADLIEGLPCEILTAGNPNVFIAVRDKAAVDRADADTAALRDLFAPLGGPLCTFVFAPTSEGAYSRMFAPQLGVPEDPATGSATGPLASYMMEYGLLPSANTRRFVSEQGTKMGRRSILHVRVNGDRGIEVGGNVTPLTEAVMTLPDR